jgi:hypothetical protein
MKPSSVCSNRVEIISAIGGLVAKCPLRASRVKAVPLTLAATLACTGHLAAAFLVAYDDAADAAYDSGWVTGSNGGYGFGAWGQFELGTFGTGQSNDNGTQGGPGIDISGRSWMAQQAIGWNGAIAGRSIGAFATGEQFELDVDFGSTASPGQSVNLLNGSDFCVVSTAGSFLSIETNAGPVMTTVPYSDGGFTIRLTRVTDGTLEVFIRDLLTSTDEVHVVNYAPDLTGTSVTFSISNPSAGQEMYVNRMSLISPVPEPGITIMAGIAATAFAFRRGRNPRNR